MSNSSKRYEGMLAYFRTTLALRMEYDPYRVLAAKDILLGNRYSLNLLTSILKEAWEVPIYIKCQRGQIYEIWLWMKVCGHDQYVSVLPARSKDTESCRHIVYYPPKRKRIGLV
jgi:hypothetical protein